MPGFYLRPEAPGPRHPSLEPTAWPGTTWTRVRHVLNWVNLSTPFGLLVAVVGGARVRRGPGLSFLADYYRWTFPAGGAFTVGDVVITRHDLDLLAAQRPTLMRHELVHSTQWAYCLGLPFVPLYVASMAWSWLRTGDRAARSVFERQAGLDLGGYRDVAVRPLGPVVGRGARRLADLLRGRSGLDRGAELGTADRATETEQGGH
ncbi:hypothetical protein [Ornithinimicrobium tianjinense]|uniref:DUF4157 domain-containing protein n=1 Tax=Ornithinimicrobium tianjinense TaxID=1195761 RepID=A0A917BM92_9MICO|nr:hypothetical protein [Ornithinimicrobium tianjinense]GGF49260.1 hypothetical protein GCM10011366_16450 [Ornithinimicrobium tianjinense]